MPRHFLMILLSFTFVANSWSQRLSFSVRNEPLEKVFLLVEKQTGYNFIYTREAITASNPLTLHVKNEELEQVLQSCFRGQPLSYAIDQKYIIVRMLKPEIPAQLPARTLKGKIIDEAGIPVAGVTIIIKPTGQPGVSDINGNFLFTDAPSVAMLIISGAEIQTMEFPTIGRAFISITVKSRISLLDETIIVAYGKTTRRYSTGAVAKVSKEKIEQQPVSNPLLSLSGRVSGLQIRQFSSVPGSYASVSIRGQNSIANGNDPLFVLDGIPFPSVTLNGRFGGPASVASSPLDNINPDDIESIEVLKDAGATAIYGSRGANGVILITTRKGNAGKPSVSLKFYQGVGWATRKLKLMKTAEYLEMRREAFENDNTTPTISNAPDLLRWNPASYTDWQKIMIGQIVHATDLTASLSGGSALTKFLLSSTYHHESTLFPGDFGSRKYSATMSLTHRSIDNKFNLIVSSSLLQNNITAPREDPSRQISLPPNAPDIHNADGSLNWENSTWVNPFAGLLQIFSNQSSNLQANLSMGIKLPLNLELKFSGGYSRVALKEVAILPTRSFAPAFNAPRQATYGHKTIETLIAEPQISYHKQSGKSDIEVLLGGSLQQSRREALYQAGTGYPSDELLSSISSASSVVTSGEEAIDYRYSGLFGRVKYNYAGKYLFNISVRRDGSSRYGPNNRFSNFSSIGIGWLFSNETLFKENKFMSFGKLVFSMGVTGNDQIGDYKYLDLYHAYSSPYQGQTVFYPTQLFNPGFGWERVNKYDAGIELGVRDDRILFSLHYYRHITGNQLVVYPLATMTGFDGILKNIPAEVLNEGLEFEANATFIKKEKFTWSASLNLTIPRNKLVSYPDLDNSAYASYYVIGKPLYIAKTYRFAGLDPASGIYRFHDYNGDGQISTPVDQQCIVDLSQKFYGGMEHTLAIGSFSASLFFQFIREPNGESYYAMFGRPGTQANQPQAMTSRWRHPGNSGPFQLYTHANNAASEAYGDYLNSDAMYTDASFIRLRNLYLSYRVPASKIRRWFIRELVLFAQGQNLFTLTHYRGLDPETRNYAPAVRMITGGIKINL